MRTHARMHARMHAEFDFDHQNGNWKYIFVTFVHICVRFWMQEKVTPALENIDHIVKVSWELVKPYWCIYNVDWLHSWLWLFWLELCDVYQCPSEPVFLVGLETIFNHQNQDSTRHVPSPTDHTFESFIMM